MAAILDFGQFTLIKNIFRCHKWIFHVKTHSYAENCKDLCLFSLSKTDFAIFPKIANFLKVPLIRCNFDQFCNGKLMETFFYLKEQKISYKKNAFLEDHGGGEDIPMLDPGLIEKVQKIYFSCHSMAT